MVRWLFKVIIKTSEQTNIAFSGFEKTEETEKF